MQKNILSQLPGALLPWYAQNKRDLPWRQDKDPYHIWLSEIMLQQTRVEAVKGYYSRFLNALPTISRLASCDDDSLHKLWEGLGYYSRVRNLKKCAQILMEKYGGAFPRTLEEVQNLPGIGPYTAGALCSICFGLPTPAVDGNVLRVIARLTADATNIRSPAFQKQVRSALAEVYPPQAGDFTQALMELGATVCGPNRKPDCNACPCRLFCRGHLSSNPEQYPIRSPKPEKRVEEMTVFLLSCNGRYALEKRPGKGLLADLWQFPNTPGKLSLSQALEHLHSQGLAPKELQKQLHRHHIFTHIRWEMESYRLEVSTPGGDFVWLTPEQINAQIALPTAFRQFWEEEENV